MKGNFGGMTVNAVTLDLAKKYVARTGVKVDCVQKGACTRGIVTSSTNLSICEDSLALELIVGEAASEDVSLTVNSVVLSGMRSASDRAKRRGTTRI